MNYSVELNDLEDGTMYYVEVVAINTANKSMRSMIESFITEELPTTTTPPPEGKYADFMFI